MSGRTLLVAFLLVAGCGGGKGSYLPQDVRDEIAATNDAIADGDGEAACAQIRATSAALARWSPGGRLTRVANDTIDRLAGVEMSCRAGGPNIQHLERSWRRTIERLEKHTRHEGGWGTVFEYMISTILFILAGWYFRRWLKS
jgi:hypothetical protein